jgi:hypothetical protein
MRWREALAALGLAVLTAGVGCGGGPKTVTQVRTQASGQPLTRAQYISQADAICQQYQGTRAELNKEFQQVGGALTNPQAHQAADLLRKAVDELKPEVQAIQALPRPTADAAVLGNLMDLQGAALTNVSNLADAFDSLDGREIRTLSAQLEKNGAEARGIAQGYGFKVCGRG